MSILGKKIKLSPLSFHRWVVRVKVSVAHLLGLKMPHDVFAILRPVQEEPELGNKVLSLGISQEFQEEGRASSLCSVSRCPHLHLARCLGALTGEQQAVAS